VGTTRHCSRNFDVPVIAGGDRENVIDTSKFSNRDAREKERERADANILPPRAGGCLYIEVSY